MSEDNTQDEKDAIARAEFLYTAGAPPDWIIVTKEEIAVIKAELAETKAKLEVAEKLIANSEGRAQRESKLRDTIERNTAGWAERIRETEAKLAKAVAALEDAEKESEFWKREANSLTEQLNELQNHNATTTLRDIRGGKDV